MQSQDLAGESRQSHPYPTLGRFEYGIVYRKARQLISKAGYTEQDLPDLVHELLTRLLTALESFDPTKGHRKSFVTAVAERSVATMLRDGKAAKRDHSRIRSLNAQIAVTNHGPVYLVDTISTHEYDARRCRYPRNNEDLAQLAIDLAGVVATLPHHLRDLAERLKTQPIAEIAREIGVPRTTLNYDVRRLRQRFEEAGLDNYL